MEQIKLEMAWKWICPSCKFPQFVEDAVMDPQSPECQDVLRRMLGLDEWDDIPEDVEGGFIGQPLFVKCNMCGLEYETDITNDV